MSSFNNHYTIIEYEGFIRDNTTYAGYPYAGYQSLPINTFDALESFVLANSSGNESEVTNLLYLSARRGIGKTITARNHVGVITMNDGTVIEILPKICGNTAGDNKEEQIIKTRKIFLEMIRALRDISFKEFQVSNLRTGRLNLLEVFISMFISEVNTLVKQGLKSTYNTIEGEECFLKGKIDVTQSVRHHPINKEKFYIRYDEFNLNSPENRVIKATLRFLVKKSGDARNRMNLTKILTLFENVEFSTDYETDFSKCVNNRSASHYAKALSWCKVFLRGSSFTAFAGSEIAIALLFPMEKIFESYIAARLRRIIPDGWQMLIQDSKFSLFDRPNIAFRLRPDIILRHEKITFVLDTKWKLLSENMQHYGISQADMYQIYAYSKKYQAEKAVLLYPLPESLTNKDISYSADDGVSVCVSLIDLAHTDEHLSALMSELSLYW